MAELISQFTSSIRTGYAPLSVQFTNISSGPFTSCLWDFGDGSQSSLIHPSHVFTQTGTFTVVLKIFGDNNQIASYSSTIIATSNTNTGSTDASLQQYLSTFKRFEPGQIAIKKTTVSGSTFSTTIMTNIGEVPYIPFGTAINTVALLSGSSVSGNNYAVYTTAGTSNNQFSTNFVGAYSGTVTAYGTPYLPTMLLFPKWSGNTSPAHGASYAAIGNYISALFSGSSGCGPILQYKMYSGNSAFDYKRIWVDRPLPSMSGLVTNTAIVLGIGNNIATSVVFNDEGFNVYSYLRQFIALDTYESASIDAPGLKTILSGTPLSVGGLMKYFGYNSLTGTAIAFLYPSDTTTLNLGTSSSDFYPGSVYIDLPHIMWHEFVGSGKTGLILRDVAGSVEVDEVTGLKFKYLRVGITEDSTIVGKVFHDKKLVLIDDQELVAVLQYTSNRNWTYPRCVPSFIFRNYYSPWTKSGTTYYITYRIRENGTGSSGDRYGFDPPLYPLHCRYISTLDDTAGNAALQIEIPIQPWATGGTNCITGPNNRWVSDRLDLIIGTGVTSAGTVTANSWRILSGGSDGIWSTKFGGSAFILSLEGTDWCYYSGVPYHLSASTVSGNSYLTIGEEHLAFGYMSGQLRNNIYKMSAVCVGKANEFNITQNPTYNNNSTIYISEVGLYNENNDLLMVGKLSKPIPKDSAKYVAIKLELDL